MLAVPALCSRSVRAVPASRSVRAVPASVYAFAPAPALYARVLWSHTRPPPRRARIRARARAHAHVGTAPAPRPRMPITEAPAVDARLPAPRPIRGWQALETRKFALSLVDRARTGGQRLVYKVVNTVDLLKILFSQKWLELVNVELDARQSADAQTIRFLQVQRAHAKNCSFHHALHPIFNPSQMIKCSHHCATTSSTTLPASGKRLKIILCDHEERNRDVLLTLAEHLSPEGLEEDLAEIGLDEHRGVGDCSRAAQVAAACARGMLPGHPSSTVCADDVVAAATSVLDAAATGPPKKTNATARASRSPAPTPHGRGCARHTSHPRARAPPRRRPGHADTRAPKHLDGHRRAAREPQGAGLLHGGPGAGLDSCASDAIKAGRLFGGAMRA
ncbi:hypothetical protein GGX14DRAFT_571307 [Mycena pura]|uniref:Uncharacterized protein n=1 Tax=Mycena pura TaxID=153505 RepID=A0AAD6Y859_9AGAR|nr:hypothetical protein GGX14DRAFT_571307 [Mycena pura]